VKVTIAKILNYPALLMHRQFIYHRHVNRREKKSKIFVAKKFGEMKKAL